MSAGPARMWRTSIASEHIKLYFAVDAALRRCDEHHARVHQLLAALRDSFAADAKLASPTAELGSDAKLSMFLACVCSRTQ